jgi:hypothetical protein
VLLPLLKETKIAQIGPLLPYVEKASAEAGYSCQLQTLGTRVRGTRNQEKPDYQASA